MKLNAKIALVAIAIVAILVTFARRNAQSSVRADSSAAPRFDGAAAAKEASFLARVETETQRTSILPTVELPEPAAPRREIFPGVVSGHVVVAGRPAGSAAGSFVRCTPTIGSPVDCFVNEDDRFEARDLPGGTVEIHCSLAGHTEVTASAFLDDTNPHASVEITIHEMRSLRVWLDDERGSPIPFDDANANILLRAYVQLSTKWADRGEVLHDRSTMRGTESQTFAPQLADLILEAWERTRTNEVNSPWCTIEFLPFEPAFACLEIQGVVVDCAAIPTCSNELHLSFDPGAVSRRFHDLDIEVVEEATSTPAANVRIWVGQSGMTNDPLWVTTDTNGRARLGYLSPASYHLIIEEGDYLRTSHGVDLNEGSMTERVRMMVQRGMRIEGRIEPAVVDEATDACEWQVLCTAASETIATGWDRSRSRLTRQGRFEFAGLQPGIWELELFLSSDDSGNPRLRVDVTNRSALDIVLKEP